MAAPPFVENGITPSEVVSFTFRLTVNGELDLRSTEMATIARNSADRFETSKLSSFTRLRPFFFSNGSFR